MRFGTNSLHLERTGKRHLWTVKIQDVEELFIRDVNDRGIYYEQSSKKWRGGICEEEEQWEVDLGRGIVV